MTLDECIERLERVRCILTGAVVISLDMAPSEHGTYVVTLAPRLTWVWDREKNISFALPQRPGRRDRKR